jgi:hypothetical protein
MPSAPGAGAAGGTGLDTFSLSGAGITLDLTAIDNQGGASPGSASRLESIERIDLTGSGEVVSPPQRPTHPLRTPCNGLVTSRKSKRAEQAYRVCLGLLNLSRGYPPQRLEAACGIASREPLLLNYHQSHSVITPIELLNLI